MKRSLQQIAEAVGARLQGDGSVEIAGVASIVSASAEDLVFVEDEKYLSLAVKSPAGAIIAGEFATAAKGKPLLINKHPKLAFARAAKFLQDANRKPTEGNVHASASLHPSARLAPDVRVEPQVVIAEHAEIGAGSWIGAGCVIGRGVRIGQNCQIYPRVTIYPSTTLGDRVTVHAGAVLGSDGFGYVRDAETGRYEKFPQIGRLVIEDDVEIGANATIDRGALDETRIGRGTKIDNLVHVGHNCRIGENVVIAAQTGISGSAVIENNVVVGGQVGIADHVRLEEGVIVGAQAGIPSNKILRGKGVVFWGTPARPLHQYLKQLALLAKLQKKE
ncbi:MAG TPA: UDP-3-O-(3-hydroxymyristoyl)glucosamine N-acyltransferase [Candidatus Aquilonibacter sp.]|nr:UDP-3-O-(3-hydroxymyristoyl)glucosamine N-acyltransferase [Candidatus Aquilonibacter sp.]